MITKQDLLKTLDSMIISASGWRGVFAAAASGGGIAGEESQSPLISEAHKIICGAAAFVFAEYMGAGVKRPQILLGNDTRPTGKEIIDAMIPVLLASGCDICYAGACAAPEIMAWAHSENEASKEFTGTDEAVIPIGFIYVSASHNPVGHNGIKFGLADGGVLPPEEANTLIANFHAFLNSDDSIKKINELSSSINHEQIEAVHFVSEISKINALKAYYEFCAGTAFSSINNETGKNLAPDDPSFIHTVSSIINKPIGIVADFNGSARAVSIDKDVFGSLGLKFDSINNEPGEIAHRIVPEGESLDPCRVFLEQKHSQDTSFILGYVPDCDGDRGNLVIWDDMLKTTRALAAQEVFALACAAEFAFQVWQGAEGKKAIAVNDPTSMRVDAIAEAFGIEVFRSEVGEANVVGLARRLREQGYTVRILGEGSAGGNITHPSAVRDPMHTVLALVKLLAIRNNEQLTMNNEQLAMSSEQLTMNNEKGGGLFEIWCRKSGQLDKYKDDFTLTDIIASLPKFVTTGAYSEDAVLRINTQDHALLKDRYQEILIREWEKRKEEFNARFGFCKWEAIAYNGLEEKRGIKRFGEAGRGGLKVLFFNKEGKPAAFLWMRGSATEPVFRIMADIEGADSEAEQLLLNWQRSMIMEADLNR